MNVKYTWSLADVNFENFPKPKSENMLDRSYLKRRFSFITDLIASSSRTRTVVGPIVKLNHPTVGGFRTPILISFAEGTGTTRHAFILCVRVMAKVLRGVLGAS